MPINASSGKIRKRKWKFFINFAKLVEKQAKSGRNSRNARGAAGRGGINLQDFLWKIQWKNEIELKNAVQDWNGVPKNFKILQDVARGFPGVLTVSVVHLSDLMPADMGIESEIPPLAGGGKRRGGQRRTGRSPRGGCSPAQTAPHRTWKGQPVGCPFVCSVWEGSYSRPRLERQTRCASEQSCIP